MMIAGTPPIVVCSTVVALVEHHRLGGLELRRARPRSARPAERSTEIRVGRLGHHRHAVGRRRGAEQTAHVGVDADVVGRVELGPDRRADICRAQPAADRRVVAATVPCRSGPCRPRPCRPSGRCRRSRCRRQRCRPADRRRRPNRPCRRRCRSWRRNRSRTPTTPRAAAPTASGASAERRRQRGVAVGGVHGTADHNERVPRPSVIAVSVLFTTAGVAHFAKPDFFESIVPDWFPSPRSPTMRAAPPRSRSGSACCRRARGGISAVRSRRC